MRATKRKSRFIIAGLMIVGVFASAYFFGGKDGAGETSILSFIKSGTRGDVLSGKPSGEGETGVLSAVFSLAQSYINDKYAFTFNYPSDFFVTFSEDVDADTLVLQNDRGEGLQILIQRIDEDIKVVTADMIKRDIPDIVMENMQDVILGLSGRGVAFISNNPIFGGQSREVWFAHNKVFYQLSADMVNDALVQAVLSSWRFEDKR